MARIALAAALGAGADVASAAMLDAVAHAFHLKLVWVCAVVAAVAYAIMVYGLATAQSVSAGAPSRRKELLWAVVPAVILIALATPAIGTLAGLAAGVEEAVIVAGP